MDTYFNEKKTILVCLIILIVIINAVVFKKIYFDEEKTQDSTQECESEKYMEENLEVIQSNEEESQDVEKETQVDEPVHTSLFDMQPFVGHIEDIVKLTTSGDQDNVGNTYPYSIWCSNYGKETPETVTYYLDGKYTSLQFSAGLSSQDNDTTGHGWLEFYNEGNTKIAETAHYTAGVLPEDYCINLEGVKKLTISVGSDSDSYLGTGSIFLLISDFELI